MHTPDANASDELVEKCDHLALFRLGGIAHIKIHLRTRIILRGNDIFTLADLDDASLAKYSIQNNLERRFD